jgi:hypothetical protein
MAFRDVAISSKHIVVLLKSASTEDEKKIKNQEK